MPNIARQMPQHDQPPTSDRAIPKERARKAWQAARGRSALPAAIVDRLWADGLVATRQAPARVAMVMMYRSEVLFRLLQDRAGWLDHEDPPSPPPRLRPAPRHGAGKG
jgi:hypothetical protein